MQSSNFLARCAEAHDTRAPQPVASLASALWL